MYLNGMEKRKTLDWMACREKELNDCKRRLGIGVADEERVFTSHERQMAPFEMTSPEVQSGKQESEFFTKKKEPSISDKKEDSCKETVFDRSKYDSSSLTESDLHQIVALFGNRIKNIYDLGAGQLWMLEEAKRVRFAFFLQVEIKAVFPLDPASFRQRADEVCDKYENLRSAFVFREVSQPYRVVLNERQPEINYFDYSDLDMDEFDEKLQQVMEADKIRGFDLEKDPLLRISVYKSCEKDTYAIVLSQPHINSDGTSLGILFADLFMGYALNMNGIEKKIESQSYQNYAKYLNTIDTKEELSYWRRELEGIDEDQQLPGQQISELDYERATYFVPFTEEELSTLKQAQKTFKATQFMILQGLWGIMVSRMKGRNDFVLGAIVSGRDAAVADSMMQAGGFINVLPVHVTVNDKETFADYIARIKQDFSEAMKRPHCSPGQIEREIGRKQNLFSHILNNHNFARPKSTGFGGGGIPGIHVLDGDCYDNLSSDLCVYFTTVDGVPGVDYSYNERAFSRSMIGLYAELYKEMLAALKDLNADSPVFTFPQIDRGRIEEVEKAGNAAVLKTAGYLKRHPVFSCADDAELISFASFCSLVHFSDGEIIVPRGRQPELLQILVSGRAVVYGESSSGWNNPLMNLRNGSILSFCGLFENGKTKELVASAAQETEILNIPVKEMLAFCNNHPKAYLTIIQQIEDTKNRYMTLWLNTD